ncbi:MAG TPA: mannosyltransferase family protein [Solirubrobacteraceae bacterium]|nr:mannosyltransferase family protein [Solirubrobacteraceae bacterium]
MARQCLLAFVVSRAIVWAAGVAAALTLDSSAPRLSRPVDLGHTADVLAAPGVRWDATWYLEIAREGYASELHAAFFPLYPLTVSAVSFVLGSPVIAGLLVSCIAFMAALLALWRLAELELDAAAAGRTVWLLALFPASLFFSAVYAESLFLALTVGAFLSARQGRWGRAALLGAAAGATRNTGWLLIVPLALMYWQARPAGGRRLDRDALWLALVPAGAAAFAAYQWAHFGDPLTGARAQRFWGREFVGPLRGLQAVAENLWTSVSNLVQGVNVASDLRQLALLAGMTLAVVALVGAARRLPAPYAVWAGLGILAMLSAPMPDYPLSATPRFLAVLFPLFMWGGAALARRDLYLLVLGASTAGLVFLTAEFSTWRFVS